MTGNETEISDGETRAHIEAVVRRSGTSFYWAMRRLPEETDYALTAGIEGDDSGWRRDCVKESDAPAYEGGVALAIQWAQLSIGGQNYQCETDPEGTHARFAVDLAPGTDRLYASFHDGLERTIAPYYVYVRRL